VLLSSVAPESSPFFQWSADASWIRLSETGDQLTFMLLGDEICYQDSPPVDRERLYSGTAQWVTPVGSQDQVGCNFLGLYEYQVMDVSETETNLQRVLVEGYSFTLQPRWKHALGRAWSLELEGTAFRQFYTTDLDDFWEGAVRLSAIHNYGHRSELSFGAQTLHRLYDTRNQYTSSGAIVTNTSLVYWRPEVGARWRHYWDAERHWRTTTKAGLLFNLDNGSGYFNYDRIQLSEQVRWQNRGWDLGIGARFGWYYYLVQRVAGEHRNRSYYVLDARIERRVGKNGLVYAAAEREWNFSNEPLDQYNDWRASGGFGLEF
jgi:hypothetical protein